MSALACSCQLTFDCFQQIRNSGTRRLGRLVPSHSILKKMLGVDIGDSLSPNLCYQMD